MQPASLLTVYCVLVGVASLGGGWLPSLLKLTHKRMQLLMSFLGGIMMGVAILHLMPHAAAEANHSTQQPQRRWSGSLAQC